MDEQTVECCHGSGGAFGDGRARQRRPGLRDAVDAALLAARRAERGAVVVESATIPAAVPAFLLDGNTKRLGMRGPSCSPNCFATGLGQRYEGGQGCVQKP